MFKIQTKTVVLVYYHVITLILA